MAGLTGKCLCGSVTYRSQADVVTSAICHCEDCQRQTGTSFSLIAIVPKEGLEIEGETLSSFTTIGDDSGKEAVRHFCANCGSPLVTFAEALPDLALIKAGTLDDRSGLEPQVEVWCDSAQPWVPIDEARPRFGRSMPAGDS